MIVLLKKKPLTYIQFLKDNYFNKKDKNIVFEKSNNIENNNFYPSKHSFILTNHGKIFLTAYESFKTQSY